MYLILRLAAFTVNLLPPDVSTRIAKGIGGGAYAIYKRGKVRAKENLRRSFPDKDEQWIENTARSAMEHIVMLAFDVLKTEKFLTPEKWSDHIELDDGMSDALKVILEGNGAILVTAHYGNF